MFVDTPFLIGGNGRDDLFGSASDETLTGGNGDDTARAGSGSDALYGGNGSDRLDGGAGNDRLFGENCGDTLTGGGGDDTLSGGNGGDIFIFDNRAATGFDRTGDFGNGDRIWTTIQLADPDGDGRIMFDADNELNLFGSSEVAISNGSRAITSLTLTGTAVVDGTTYYAYAGDNGSSDSGKKGFADTSLFHHDYFLA